jgi:putative transposase
MQASTEGLKGFSNSAENRRRSIRLVEYNYSNAGAYFVTICVRDKKSILGHIRNGDVDLSPIGEIAHRCWNEIPNHFLYVELDAFIVMPNHLHGIIVLNSDCRGVQLNASEMTTANYYESISP